MHRRLEFRVQTMVERSYEQRGHEASIRLTVRTCHVRWAE